MKILLITLGVVVVTLNLLLWYSKRNSAKTEADKSANDKDELDAAFANSNDFLNSSKAKPLKQAAAAELGISVEELESMSVGEIKQLAKRNGLI